MSTTSAATSGDGTFTGLANVNLFYRSWRPSTAPRGIVVIVPGFNSHSGYYEWTANQLVGERLAVYALDLRGRGRSDGERFFVNSFEDYVGDVDGMVKLARGREASGLPVFILGHSAGGVISCLYASRHQDELAGLICESFAYRVPAPDFAIAALKGLAHLAPHAHVLRLKNEDFSRDQTVVRRMNDDSLIAHETQPTRTVAELARADELLETTFPAMKLPVLILHGTADRATKPSGSEFFFANAGSPDKTLKLYDGHYHDLLNDVDRDEVMGDILGWLRARLTPSRQLADMPS